MTNERKTLGVNSRPKALIKIMMSRRLTDDLITKLQYYHRIKLFFMQRNKGGMKEKQKQK